VRKPPPPLSPELEALLAPHRALVPLAPAIEARAVARAAAAAAESPVQGAGRVSSRPRWVFAAAAGAVLALGAAAYAARAWIGVPSSGAPARVAPIASPRAREPSPAVVSVTPEVEPPPTIAPRVPPHARRASGKTYAAPVPTNAELQLLRTARQDVTRGDFARALTVIEEHVRRFRNGGLVEEREALRVKSLAGLRRHEEARRAAVAFHARFPHSVFLSTFERMKDPER
jgi:hypothetical protein